jgi:hypothetical protein
MNMIAESSDMLQGNDRKVEDANPGWSRYFSRFQWIEAEADFRNTMITYGALDEQDADDEP